ncbi:peptidoglycan-binding domain-containing protein [Kitasatospora sp. NPDC097605]|uniref:peptidoglycan-binding domain-containing protein n=1 Tax=Kitasatospora sp. NPDC097605 TaxID=3157226 RepID=UPI00332620D1
MRKIITGLAVAGLILAGGVSTATTASAAGAGQPCSGYSTAEPLLRAGATGDAVKELQCELNRAITPSSGYYLTVDGVFGQATLRAVYRFQGCVGLQVDGEVGPQTWSKLDYWSLQSSYAC